MSNEFVGKLVTEDEDGVKMVLSRRKIRDVYFLVFDIAGKSIHLNEKDDLLNIIKYIEESFPVKNVMLNQP